MNDEIFITVDDFPEGCTPEKLKTKIREWEEKGYLLRPGTTYDSYNCFPRISTQTSSGEKHPRVNGILLMKKKW